MGIVPFVERQSVTYPNACVSTTVTLQGNLLPGPAIAAMLRAAL